MNFSTFEPLDIDSWPSLVASPSHGFDNSDSTPIPSFDSTPTTVSSFNFNPATTWQDQSSTVRDEWQSGFPKIPTPARAPSPATHKRTVSFTASSGVRDSTQVPDLEPRSSASSSVTTSQEFEKCSCLRSLLLISEQLDHHVVAITSFTATLALFSKVIQICEQYAQCTKCEESLTEVLCVLALRRASVCYRQIASTTEGTTVAAAYETKVHCRVGRFETEVVLDMETSKAVMCNELERAVSVTGEIQQLLDPGSRMRSQVDPVTRRYHQDLVKSVQNDLHVTLSSLQKP